MPVSCSNELNPWITPGQTPGTDGQPATGGRPDEPRVFFFNALIQLFGSGATGFNIYTADGFIDMGMVSQNGWPQLFHWQCHWPIQAIACTRKTIAESSMLTRSKPDFASEKMNWEVYCDTNLPRTMRPLRLQWLAVRDVVELVTPYEDLICDGSPAAEGSLHSLSSSAVVNAMVDGKDGTLLIASSTMPSGVASSFTVESAKADGSWLMCDLTTKRSVAASAGGKATWASGNELGSMLAFGPATACHGARYSQ
eukprot:COSAG06_NODE_4078_length_4596_cov_3453.381281_3_plen_254_part_00